MAPGAGFDTGHNLAHCGAASSVCEAVSIGSVEASLFAQTIQSPLRDSGTRSSDVASRRNMTPRRMMPKGRNFCQAIFGEHHWAFRMALSSFKKRSYSASSSPSAIIS